MPPWLLLSLRACTGLVYIFFTFGAWHISGDWIKNNVTEWRLTKVIWKINGYNFKVYSSGPLCLSSIFLVPRLVLRGFPYQLLWLKLDAERGQLPENVLLKASVKQLPFHFLDIAAILNGKKLEPCFLLLYLCQRYKFSTFFGVWRILFKLRNFQGISLMHLRSELIWYQLFLLGEKFILESRGHEALFLCLL